jgi:hypothetical protein
LASADQVDVAIGKLSVTIPRLGYAKPVPYLNLHQSLLINRKVLDRITNGPDNIGPSLRTAPLRIGVIAGSSHAVWGSTTFPKAAPITTASPMPPSPNTATVLPGSTRAVLRTAPIPVVFMTGLTETEHVVAALAAGTGTAAAVAAGTAGGVSTRGGGGGGGGFGRVFAHERCGGLQKARPAWRAASENALTVPW